MVVVGSSLDASPVWPELSEVADPPGAEAVIVT